MSSSTKESTNSKGNENTNKQIELITSRRKYRIKVQQFITYSLKIRKLWEIGRLPRRINLLPYDRHAVKALVGYIENVEQKNIILSFYALADLLDLSRSLLMLGLLRQLENILVELASQKIDALMQALLIVGGDRSIFGGLASRQKIEAIAANKFQSIVKHKLFGYIPAIIFANVIARCDLNVQKEMDVVDAGILWIWHQKRPLINTLLVFSRIRSTLLSPGDFNTIQERLKTLPNGEKLIPIIMTTLWSTFCHRCCIIKEHIEKSMMRCGVPNPSDDAAVDLSKLPLSGKFSVKQKWRNREKWKMSSERRRKRRGSKRKYSSKEDHEKLKAKSKEKDDDLSKSTQLASKSQKSKSSKKSEESEKSWSTRRSKEDKSRKRDSRSRKLRRAMRKKFCNSKTAPDNE